MAGGLSAKVKDGIGAVGPVSDNIGAAQFVGHYIGENVPLDCRHHEVSTKFADKTSKTKLLIGMCIMIPRKVFNEVGLLDASMILGADDLEFSWRLRQLGYELEIALDVFVHHEGHKSFQTRESADVSELVNISEARLIRKLSRFYGKDLPTSFQLWGCNIFNDAFSRKTELGSLF